MPVLKTASPKVSPTAPYPKPRKVRPSSSTSSAGRSLVMSTASPVPDPLGHDPDAEEKEHHHGDRAGRHPGPGRTVRRKSHTSTTPPTTHEACRLRRLMLL